MDVPPQPQLREERAVRKLRPSYLVHLGEHEKTDLDDDAAGESNPPVSQSPKLPFVWTLDYPRLWTAAGRPVVLDLPPGDVVYYLKYPDKLAEYLEYQRQRFS